MLLFSGHLEVPDVRKWVHIACTIHISPVHTENFHVGFSLISSYFNANYNEK